MKKLSLLQWTIAFSILFTSNQLWSQAGHGNGGSDYILHTFSKLSHAANKENLEFPSESIKSENIDYIKDEELRIKTCRDFYKTYFSIAADLSSIATNAGFDRTDLFSHLLLTPALPDNLPNPRDLRFALNRGDEKVYCSKERFQIAKIRAENGFHFVAANFHEEARLVIDPGEWNKRLRVYSPWCEETPSKSLDICLTRVRNAIAIHEVIALIYDKFETNNIYYYSLLLYLESSVEFKK